MSKMWKTIAAGFVGVAMTASASAGTIDFKAAADADERGFVDGTGETIDGFALTFSATTSDTGDGYAYLDSGAGLGVCDFFSGVATDGNEHGGGTNECHDSSDDNLQLGETATVEFEFAVDLDGLLFRAEGHGLIGGDFADDHNLTITTDVHALAFMTFQEAMDASFLGITSITFGYGSLLAATAAGPFGVQYYVSAMDVEKVPAPAALGLLGFGLAGIGGLSRRRRS